MDEFTFKQRLVSSGLSESEVELKAGSLAEVTRALLADGVSRGEMVYAFVPGRIEVLGKHTDYAGGRSLICGVERGFSVAAAARDDDDVRIIDVRRHDRIEFKLSPGLISHAGHWSNYPATVAYRIAQNFPGAISGADIAFVSDLPPAAGLSSSSALVIAIFSVLARINALQTRDEYRREIKTDEDLAGYLGTVENGQNFGSLVGDKGVGTFGGSQDHTAIQCCRPGQLSRYSFCPVRYEGSIALPDEFVFVIGVSGISADKTGNALEKYNRLSLLAREVLSIWQTATGREDATLMSAACSSPDAPDRIRDEVSQARGSAFSRQQLLDRFDQFWTECNEIIPGVTDALAKGDIKTIGLLVDRSQQGAENLLGNQVPETITLAKSARDLGAVAASAFGAGFGGSVWALVKTDHAEEFKSEWAETYRSCFSEPAKRSEFFISRPGPSIIEFAD